MRKLCVLICGLVLMISGSSSAQVPLSQIEGYLELYVPSDSSSLYLGYKAGQKISLGELYNVFIGSKAGRDSESGDNNVYIGQKAGERSKDGSDNVYIGKGAGAVALGSNNTYVGHDAGSEGDSTESNAFFGSQAGDGATGSFNTYVGANAGEDASDGELNTVVGYEAGDNNDGSNNVLVGSFSGDSNTGDENTFVGSHSGQENIGSENTFVGFQSGEKNEADGNTFVGFNSGSLNSTGRKNAFFGSSAGRLNSTGTANTFLGNRAGVINKTGGGNVFVGNIAGEQNKEGDYQCFMGWQAGGQSRSGSNSVVIGTAAGLLDTAIINSVYIGYSAGQLGFSDPISRQGNVFIGNYAGYNHRGNNRLFIANSSVDKTQALIYGEFDNGGLLRINGDLQIAAPTTGVNSRLLMKGVNGDLNEVIRYDVSNNDVVMGSVTGGGGKLFLRANANTRMAIIENGDIGIGTTAPTQKLHVEGGARFTENIFADNLSAVAGTHDLRWNAITGLITTSTSDVRLKDNVKTITHALDKVMHLRGVSFNWKELPDGQPQLGLIAQEVKDVLPEVVSINKNGYYGVDYSETIGVFVEAIKEQQAMIEGQKNEISDLKLLLNKALFQIEKINESLSVVDSVSFD